MDDLFNVLMQRQLGGQEPSAPQTPTVLPSTPAKVPQQAKRFANAEQIKQAYANGWAPNPILLRAELGHR